MPAALVLVPDNSSTMIAAAADTSVGGQAAVAGGVVLVHDETTAVLTSSVVEDKEYGRVDDLGDRSSSGGNRWPRQETLALLKIRSEMDAGFRDSSLKAPLWEDVSRKLSELGYYRSAKKCKEKFENVYKYHRRTKEGRTGKQDGKTYRFFDELEAFHHQNHHHHSSPPPSKRQLVIWPNNNNISIPNIMAQSNGPHQNGAPPHIPPSPQTAVTQSPVGLSHPNINGLKPNSAMNNLFSGSTSSTASDQEFEVEARDKKKRKWKYFFRRLTNEVLEKQEKLQEQFLEAIAKCERERVLREDAWRREEMARNEKEHHILAQERSSSAARDTAVIAFLHKVSGGQNVIETQSQSRPPALIMPVLMPPPPQKASKSAALVAVVPTTTFEISPQDPVIPPGSSRWPRGEVEQLINLRSRLDMKYQEAGPKGSLWEEISAGMRLLGYNRSAKRCKEKWENINKYYKKVKESCKSRPEDSKTCPYFHQLDILYQKKYNISNNVGSLGKPLVETMQPLIKVQPDQTDRNLDDEDGESTEVDEDRHDDDDDQMEMVTSYKESIMEMVESR